MSKILKGKNLLASLLVMTTLLVSFPAVYAEEIVQEIPVEEIAVEIQEEAPVSEPEPEAVPEETLEEAPVAEPEPEMVPEEIQEEAPAADPEPEAVPEEILEEAPVADPEPEMAPEEIPEEAPAAASEGKQEETQETESADEANDEASDDEALIELEDDDAGSVSEELLEEFNNPETYEETHSDISAEIEMKAGELRYGGDITLVAKVSGANMKYRIVWEANDGDGRGWFTVGSGSEYTFTLTPEVVKREYRVALFSVD